MSFSLGTIRSSRRRQSDSTKYKNTKNLVLENIARQFKKKKKHVKLKIMHRKMQLNAEITSTTLLE